MNDSVARKSASTRQEKRIRMRKDVDWAEPEQGMVAGIAAERT